MGSLLRKEQTSNFYLNCSKSSRLVLFKLTLASCVVVMKHHGGQQPAAVLQESLSRYGERSSVHGVAYTLDRSLSRWAQCQSISYFLQLSSWDRCLWLLLLFSSLALSGFMIWQTVTDWRARQVQTTLKTLTKPVDG